jgi:serine phosphatase RsbU (regulator of sigma subunit)
MFIARIDSEGVLEYVNCGHVLPLIISHGEAERKILRPDVGNLPVGLIPGAAYECGHARLAPNDRLILVTDGVTEAENSTGEFFDNPRLEEVALASCDMEDIFAAISAFRGTTPLTDDCTVVDLLYTGPR